MMSWQERSVLLTQESGRILSALMGKLRDDGDELAVIGFVYEFGRGALTFDWCANTVRNGRALSGSTGPLPDELRWNSGDFDFPSGICCYGEGWSDALWGDLLELDRLAFQEVDLPAEERLESNRIHEGVADLCCNVLATLAKRGVFGEWRQVDFSVGALLDSIEVVRRRDQQIRTLIGSDG